MSNVRVGLTKRNKWAKDNAWAYFGAERGIFLENLVLKYFFTKREGGDNGQRNIWGLFLLSLQPKIHKSSNSTDPTKLTRHFHVLQNCIFCYCWSMSTTVLLWTSRYKHIWHISTKWKLLSYEASEFWLCLEKTIPHDPRLSPNHHRNMYWENRDFGHVTLRSFCVKNHTTRMS